MAARDARDFAAARRCLADQGFQYESPISRFDSADAFVEYIALSSGILLSCVTRKVFVDGPDVCHFLTLNLQISEKFSAQMVQWAQVRDGRIARIEALFDASGYRRLFPGEETPR